MALGKSEVERMQESGEEEEKFHSSEHISEAHSSANSEWDEELWLLYFAFGVDEAAWSEFFWFVPKSWIHMDSVEKRHHVGSGGDCVAV